jgi:hypothetical protein
MNIVDLLHKKRGVKKVDFSFDTKSSTPSDNAFVIRRESDNTEQTYSYTQVNDGTFDTFVAGSEGAIKEWYSLNGLLKLTQNTNANQPRLKSGITNPYVDDYSQEARLLMTKTMDMSGDSIVSVILRDETNSNNQRANIIIRGSGDNLFAVQLTPGAGNVVYNKRGIYQGDYGFTYSNNGVFKLFTFERRSGVNKLYINNTEIATTAGNATYTVKTDGVEALEHTVILGSHGGTAGKITKYQHLGLVTGVEATNTNISTYNTDLMTKYGL